LRRRTDVDMATVELSFSPLPAHVRTARLVAAAIARRAGIEEPLLDEVRLAVGEACSRAVGLHRRAGVNEPVVVRLEVGTDQFSVEVQDRVQVQGMAPGPIGVHDADDPARLEQLLAGPDGAPDEQELSLAVIVGLVDDVEISTAGAGGLIRMTWPALEPV